MKKLVVIAALAIGAILVFNKVTGKGTSPETLVDLPGATFAASIPVYPGAKYIHKTGGDYSERAGEWGRYEVWMLTFADPKEQVVSFYDRKFPNAERDATGDSVSFTVDPDGSGQRAEIRVFDGELEIKEFRKPRS